jgi:4-amino-4-deoxy-L-arabinose transferase-like glycosyltransferase/putative flippase GtrA
MKAQPLSSSERPRYERFARVATLSRFLLVGFTGIAVNEIVYVGLVQSLAVWFVVAAIISTEVSTTWNFLGNEYWAFSGRKFVGPRWVRYLAYAAMNNALLVLRVPTLWLLTDIGHMTPAWSNLFALGLLFAVRFAVSDGWVWRKKGANPFSEVSDAASGAAAFRYDISRLDSDAELPELAYFRTALTTPPDIRIRIRRVGALPTARVRLLRDGDRVTYREHLGVLGADFNLTLGEPIEIEASPLLGMSRHVLYTNVVEALLRFVLVSKGYVLLHSAGMDVDGRASLLSAQTDTGKTSTVINMIRERGWGFISDDMAIIDPKGRVRTFPKPMTLSYHTMVRAVDANSLGAKQRMQLQVQSRIHSKSGRSVGKGLGTLNVPIMSINSVVQLMVPPPKYHITSLLPTHITDEAPIDNIFLMERGEPIEERVSLKDAVDQLIDNTDDAYGFPPFATLAPNLVINGADYQALRDRERELLTAALRRVKVWRLRVRGHEWGELLPRLIAENAPRRRSAAVPVAPGREPVGIPVEAEGREPVGIPVEAEAGLAEPAAAAAGDYARQAAGFLEGARPQSKAELAATGISFAAASRPEIRARDFGSEPSRSLSGHATEREDGGPATLGNSGLLSGRQARAPGSDSTAASDGSRLDLADVLAIPALGGFRFGGSLPLVPDFASARDRAIDRIRASGRLLLALGAILMVGAVVRLWSIGAVGLNNDEAVYAGQGASLAGDQTYLPLFAIFRAHPLLVQFINSIPFRFFGVNDITPRLVSVAFGLGGVGLAYSTGAMLYNRRVGLVAAAVLALMPYDVVVTRQALLDGPETTLFLLSIYELARFIRGGQLRWLYGAAFTTGLTVLAKETAILIVPVAVAFLLLVPEIRISFRNQLIAVGLFAIAVAPYPAAILIGKGTNAAGSFVLWEVLRQPNHTWTFYADVLPAAMGPLVFLIGLAALFYVVRRGRWEDRLLTTWIAIPVAFFEIWPVKGFQYLMPIAPAVAILVGLAFDRMLARVETAEVEATTARAEAADVDGGSKAGASAAAGAESQPAQPRVRLLRGYSVPSRRALGFTYGLLAVTLLSIAIPTASAVGSTSISGSLAGTGGLPGGRETGTWIKDNVPAGATFLTEGPTLANIVEFYGQRHAYGLSVSPNPIRRNPAYDPILNPDRALQLNQIQYIATDVWSAQRSPFFNSVLLRYISRYHGTLVYSQSADWSDATGKVTNQVVIKIYEVRP